MTMKPFILISIVVAGVTIGTFQRSKLHELERRIAQREKPASSHAAIDLTDTASPPAEARHVSQAESDSLREYFVAVFLSRMDRSRTAGSDDGSYRQPILTAAKFTANEIAQLMQELREDPRLAELTEEDLFNYCLEIFSSAAPAATMRFLEGHRDLPRWSDQYRKSFNGFLVSDPREAIRWYDAQVAHGNPDVAGSSMRSLVLRREARIDPDKMLARALSPDFVADSDALFHVGGFVASSLHQAPEHREFLAALRRAQDKSGAPAILEKIRSEYVGALASKLGEYPFEDASVIADSEFSSGEKLDFLAIVSGYRTLADQGKWVDWFLRIDLETWNQREVRPGTSSDHPASASLMSWAESDYQAAGKWLEKVPPGPLRSEMVQKYSTRIAVIDPDKAASYIPEISDDKERRDLIDKIAKALESKDPQTAAAFRAAHPVSR